ncbi:hypothetical protein BDW59DRAFT_148977 [Aspergillus cavernicola]|uniref:Zn(2)-C6 fungal-type domain-containing protein n=1 Tax=Aspergillus cavernicola TaxID=176166 RepID=A0ABR4I6F0_9EURO
MPPTMTNSAQSVRKRRRPAYSCAECRRRKVRCDRVTPCCGQCGALGLASSCVYVENRRVAPIRCETSSISSEKHGDRPQSAPQEPHSINGFHAPATSGRIQGTISKTRVFGHGHWMNTFSMVEGLAALQPIGEWYETLFRSADDGPDEVVETVAECKRLARSVKKQRPSRRCLPADIHRFFPDRKVMDELVELYFSTFESCYRILYQHSFRIEYEGYMNSTQTGESSFLLQLLLVMAVAGPLHADVNVRREMAAKARLWIHMAQTWLSGPLEKDRITLKGIQIHCLLLLSRQVNQVGADLVWISAGSLMRMAMQMGLHQDPDFIGDMSLLQKELRRRLWYTILEMNVQAALDSGMSPMIMDGDYNTKPPSDMTDQALDEESSSKREVSLQSLLARSLSLRLRATRVINSMQEEASYDRVLELGNALASTCRDVAIAIEQATSVKSFAYSFCSHLLRRFPLCLHYRYALKARANPLYSHSRQVCLEAALDLVALLEDDLYGRVLCTGGGMFRDIITRGVLLVFLELSPDPEADTSAFAKKRNRARQEPLLQDARRIVQYTKDRVWNGDTNVKIYVCPSMMMAQAEARLDGLPVKEAISKAMHESLGICHDMLKEMASNTTNPASGPDLDFWANGMAGFEVNLDSDFDSLNDGIFDFDFTDLSSQWAGQTWL